MAPVISITVHALLGSVGLKIQEPGQNVLNPSDSVRLNHQEPIQNVLQAPKTKQVDGGSPSYWPTITTTSWGLNRMDIFGLEDENGWLAHKYWDGSQWQPGVSTFENLGTGYLGSLASTSWGQGRMDLFARADNGSLAHKYWEGSQWRPSASTYEFLDADLGNKSFNDLAVTSWGPGRLDVFAVDPESKVLLHKYYDGSAWQPAQGTEKLGGELPVGVSAVSWGPNRLDIIARDGSGKILHLYFDGTKYSNWEDMQAPSSVFGAPIITSWGENRLDIFVIDNSGALLHTAWDGSQWLDWEKLSGAEVKLTGVPAAVSWSKNRLDIVARGEDGGYYYKFWDGSSWRPNYGDEGSNGGLYPKGGNFKSSPSLVSWGDNRLDIYGVTAKGTLGHQTWYGSGWYPEWGFEELGGTLE